MAKSGATRVTPTQTDKIEMVLESWPAPDMLDHYERIIICRNNYELSERDRDLALGILKLLQALN